MGMLDYQGLNILWNKVKDYLATQLENVQPTWENLTGKPTWITTTKPKYTATEVNAIASNAKGVINGVATLDATGKVPTEQLPGFVDSVVEGYFNGVNFYTDAGFTNQITGQQSVIYIDIATNVCYRFGGTLYITITSADEIVPITAAEIDQICV